MLPRDERAIAHHEAGHAVMAIELGIAFGRVVLLDELDDEGRMGWVVSPDRPEMPWGHERGNRQADEPPTAEEVRRAWGWAESMLMMFLAGCAAQAMYCNPAQIRRRHWSKLTDAAFDELDLSAGGDPGDYAQASIYAQLCCNAYPAFSRYLRRVPGLESSIRRGDDSVGHLVRLKMSEVVRKLGSPQVWPGVEAIAAELLEHRELSSQRAEATYRGAVLRGV